MLEYKSQKKTTFRCQEQEKRKMDRHGFAFTVNRGRLGAFLTELGKQWPQIREAAAAQRISNFSIWSAELFFFGYYESESGEPCTEKLLDALSELLGGNGAAGIMGNWISDPSCDMKLMYDDFRIVREDKSMIRHRVFMTHLLNGDTAEYRKRHDGKKAERKGMQDAGPDTNFSIWNAGDYIFGYDEIDTSMEHESAPEELQDTITWERHMLDLMEWITDDVDWITGEHHSHVKRICWLQ